MQLLQRASFSSPAIHPLLILCGCCVLVHLARFVCITSGESNAIVVSLWIVTWSIAGGTGSYSLFLTVLCIKFQDTNSMSVPRRNFKRLHSLFKQDSLKKPPIPSKSGDKKQRRKSDRKGNRQGTLRPVHKKDVNDKLKKSKHNFLPHISSTGAYSTISVDDHADIKNQVNPPFASQHSNLLSEGNKNKHIVPHFLAADKKGKRKSGRRGKNTNEFPASSSSLFSSIGSSLIGGLLLNQNEEEALRRKILARVEELDPLMCLPKVLCGYTSRQRRKNYSRFKTTTTTTTTTTRRPTLKESVIDEYLHLLGIIPPIPKEIVEDNLKEADKYIKAKKYLKAKKYQKKSSKERKKVVRSKKKKKYESEEYDGQEEQSGSGSASAESNEATQYERHPVRMPYSGRMPYPYSMHRPYTYPFIQKPHAGKFLFNRNKDSEENDIEDGDDSEIDDEADDIDELFDEEDVKYLVKRKKMENMMAVSGSHSDENWWEPFDNPKVTMPYYYYPPQQPTWDGPLPNDDILSTSDGGISGWFTNMFSSFMPRISWAGGSKKDPDDIKSDPFFTSFDGRSLTNRESRSFPSNENNKLKLPSSSTKSSKPRRKAKHIDLEQHFGVRVNSRQIDYMPGDNRDPAEKYRTAVEIGTRVSSPDQCDFIYNGCPLSYDEILSIINEPPRERPISARKPSTTSASTSSSTKGNMTPSPPTTTPSSPPPPPPPPQQIVVPLHQQQQLPYQPPQTILLHQQQPQFHVLHPQQSSYEHQAQLQLYSHPFQPQPQYILQNPQFQQQQQSALFSSIDGMTKIAKSRTKPHLTKIHQALPSGELQINLHYQPEKKEKSNSPEGDGEISNLNIVEDTVESHLNSGASTSNEHNSKQQTDSFSHKVLTNYEFFPSNGYKIRRKNGDEEEPDMTKDVKVVSNSIKVGSYFGSSLDASDENNNNNNMEDVSSPKPGKSTGTNINRRQQRVPSRVAYKSKGKGKYQRKQMFKNPSSSAPPLRHSSNHQQRIQPQQQHASSQETRKTNRNGNNNMKIMRKKYGKEKKKQRKKGIQDDDNGSGNSSSNKSSAASASNEQLETEYLNEALKSQRKRLKKRKRRKPHLHKQSSDSIEAKKRLEIAGSNAIYPIYGHPFPPPYAGYYHTLYPSTPTSPSFFSYIFGR